MPAKRKARVASARAQAAAAAIARRRSQALPRRAASTDLTVRSLQLGRKRALQILARYRKTRPKKRKGLAAHAERVALMRVWALAPAGTLVVQGDSWFDFGTSDIVDLLQNPGGYIVDGYAEFGTRIVQLANDGPHLDELCAKIADHHHGGNTPKAILLSGGGNDIADNFKGLLYYKNSAQSGWNLAMLDGFVDQTLKQAYVTIVSALDKFCKDELKLSIPILVHGYSHPVPDGRGVLGKRWLKPKFEEQGYTNRQECTELAGQFIDRFNVMLSKLKTDTGIASVVYVNLRPALSSGPDWKTWWTNELHPTRVGFQAVTKVFTTALDNL